MSGRYLEWESMVRVGWRYYQEVRSDQDCWDDEW